MGFCSDSGLNADQRVGILLPRRSPRGALNAAWLSSSKWRAKGSLCNLTAITSMVTMGYSLAPGRTQGCGKQQIAEVLGLCRYLSTSGLRSAPPLGYSFSIKSRL